MGQPLGTTRPLLAQGSQQEEPPGPCSCLQPWPGQPSLPSSSPLGVPPPSSGPWCGGRVGLLVLGSGREHPLQHKNHCLGSADPGARLMGNLPDQDSSHGNE